MTLARRGLLWLAVFALVAAQALGLMHRVVHAPLASVHTHGHDHAAQAHEDHGNGVAGLFAGHDDDSTCRLFDPLNHDGAPCVPAVVLPAILASFFLDVFQGEFLARWAALYDARGPPALR